MRSARASVFALARMWSVRVSAGCASAGCASAGCASAVRASAVCVSLMLAAAAHAEDDSFVRDARAYVKAAQEARQRGDRAAVLDALIAAAALRPQHASIVFELAAAQAAQGRLDEATAALRRTAAMGIPFPTDAREEFASCRERPACRDALAAVAAAGARKETSTVAFTFPGKALVPEGIAYDAATDAFFVSSIRERRVLRLDRARQPRLFADRASGLWAAMGMTVDAPRRRLWVATSAVDEMAEAATEGEKGRAGLVALDLETGKPVGRYVLATPGVHVLGDLVAAPNGDVYTTDSVSPAVYRLRKGGDTLEPIAAGEPFVSPQGLALSADGARLLVADYAKGVFAIALDSRRVRLLEAPRDADVLGIDGLYRAGNALLAIQNGTNPTRLLRLAIDGDRIASVEVLDAGHSKMDEPTLGVVAGDRFFYVANSQGAAFAGGKADPKVTLQDPVVLTLPIAP